ncbi:hypothetical protein HK101_005664 [Irineochytrium annulatum]|nr:hypothetical protein HK101_005664 [Irineochytrium annulatum]
MAMSEADVDPIEPDRVERNPAGGVGEVGDRAETGRGGQELSHQQSAAEVSLSELSSGSVMSTPSSRIMSSVLPPSAEEVDEHDSALALLDTADDAEATETTPEAFESCEWPPRLDLRLAGADALPEWLEDDRRAVAPFGPAAPWEEVLARRDGAAVAGVDQVIGLSGFHCCWISEDFLKSALKRRPAREWDPRRYMVMW